MSYLVHHVHRGDVWGWFPFWFINYNLFTPAGSLVCLWCVTRVLCAARPRRNAQRVPHGASFIYRASPSEGSGQGLEPNPHDTGRTFREIITITSRNNWVSNLPFIQSACFLKLEYQEETRANTGTTCRPPQTNWDSNCESSCCDGA